MPRERILPDEMWATASEADSCSWEYDRDHSTSTLLQRKKSTEQRGAADGATQPREDVRRLRKSVSTIGKRTEDVIHDAAFAAPEEALVLIPAVQKAIRQLEELLKYLEQQVNATPAHAVRGETQQEETARPT